ncbi:MAG: hypothetical protein QM741_00545 [Rudaea sp.]|uniref:hypothetical protein n=1 Tax=Rudaea sp. TaxID=2136325 RepID=UPI0039E6F550
MDSSIHRSRRAGLRRIAAIALALAAIVLFNAGAADEGKPHAKRRPDLADAAAGVYFGEVISDSHGSSQSGVTITVERTAPNTVRVTSSYPRLPAFTTRLTRAMQTIQQTGGDATIVFLLDLSRTPRHLDVTVDEASWSGDRQHSLPPSGDER